MFPCRGKLKFLSFLGMLLAAVIGLSGFIGASEPNLNRSEEITWQRHPGNPVLKAGQITVRAGAKYWAMADPSVLYDEGIFKMWFGYGGLDNFPKKESVRVRAGYAESSDGYTWKVVTAPALDVGLGWDRTNAETPCVLKDDSLPEGHPRKYRLYYSGLDEAVNRLPFDKVLEIGMGYGIGLAFSADGRFFTRLSAAESPYGVAGLVLAPNQPARFDQDMWDFIHIGDPHVVYHDSLYHLWYSSMVHQAKVSGVSGVICYAASEDGIHWQKHGVVLTTQEPWERMKPHEPNVGQPYVLWHNDRFEMFYNSKLADQNPDGNTAAGIGLAWSIDGQSWIKYPSPIFVTNHGLGERKGMIVGPAILIKDGTQYLYYPVADKSWDDIGINLATAKEEPLLPYAEPK